MHVVGIYIFPNPAQPATPLALVPSETAQVMFRSVRSRLPARKHADPEDGILKHLLIGVADCLPGNLIKDSCDWLEKSLRINKYRMLTGSNKVFNVAIVASENIQEAQNHASPTIVPFQLIC